MTGKTPDVFVVIRSAGERTEQLCKKLVLDQGIDEQNLLIVREAPFSASLRKSFEAGVRRGVQWTLCVDADVLLREKSIGRAVQLMEQQDENTLGLQGFVLDKFFGGPREAGFHLYRTSLLKKAVELIPKNDHIRPERATINAMQDAGFPFVTVPVLLGLHDFEQHYADIFRKCFVQAHKHLYRAELLISVLRGGMEQDRDLEVGLRGFVAGIYHNDDVQIDATQQIYKDAFIKLRLTEKNELNTGGFDFEWIENVVKTWNEPEMFKKYLPYSVDDLEKGNVGLQRKSSGSKEPNGIMIIPGAIGRVLVQTGTKLLNLASRRS